LYLHREVPIYDVLLDDVGRREEEVDRQQLDEFEFHVLDEVHATVAVAVDVQHGHTAVRRRRGEREDDQRGAMHARRQQSTITAAEKITRQRRFISRHIDAHRMSNDPRRTLSLPHARSCSCFNLDPYCICARSARLLASPRIVLMRVLDALIEVRNQHMRIIDEFNHQLLARLHRAEPCMRRASSGGDERGTSIRA
jgi:hypothetical protein